MITFELAAAFVSRVAKMEAPPAIVLSEDEELFRQIREGKAIFSTNCNRIPKREAKPGEASIIMRSDPLADVDALVESLQEQFPQVCKNITAPIQNIYEYFDHYDVQLHGTGIVHSVLNKIAESNATRGMRILSFTEYWKNAHSRRFYNINEHTRELFTEEEFKEYGKDFLQDAFIRLKELRRMMVPLVPEVFSGMINSRLIHTVSNHYKLLPTHRWPQPPDLFIPSLLRFLHQIRRKTKVMIRDQIQIEGTTHIHFIQKNSNIYTQVNP